MLGLPKTTELNKQLPKKAIYDKFEMNNKEKEHIDSDISKIYIVNELSPERTHIKAGNEVKTIFVLLISLKTKKFDNKNIIKISKLIPQNMLLVLQYEGEVKLAVYYTKLMQTEWAKIDDLKIELKGLDLDKVWDNLIKSVEGGDWIEELSLDENLALHEEREKLQKEISKLGKLIKKEKQPKKKFELFQRLKELEGKL